MPLHSFHRIIYGKMRQRIDSKCANLRIVFSERLIYWLRGNLRIKFKVILRTLNNVINVK